MIKIAPGNLPTIARLHLDHCSPQIKKRIIFYKDLLNRIGNKTLVTFDKIASSPAKKYDLDSETIKVFMQPFLKAEYRKKGKSKLSIKGVETILSTKYLSPIQDVNNLSYFRSLLAMVKEIELDLEDILIGLPFDLNRIKDKSIYHNLNKDQKTIIQNILPYEQLSGKGFEIILNAINSTWGSYTLTSNLKLSSCVYCNRNWINTIGTQKNKTTNPQLDHFFGQAEYPILRLSFYNLIPSCETCNARLKHDTEFIYGTNLHPYEDCYANAAKFRAYSKNVESIEGMANDFLITLEYTDLIPQALKNKITKNHSLFQIDKIYEIHGDIVSEIYQKKRFFNTTYLDILKNSIEFGRDVTTHDLYRLAFGNYLLESDLHKRPFSKLTKDIVDQLKFKI